MKYILLFCGGDERWESMPESEVTARYAEIGRWFGTHGEAGRIVTGEELQPARTATTVRFDSGTPVVSDGPFIESKESVGGYAVVEVGDLDEALAMAKTWPGLGAVEVRPLVDHSQDM